MKRSYTRIKIHERRIIELREAGKTRREIGNELGLTKDQIKGWIKGYNKRVAASAAGLLRPRARRPAVTLAEYKYECKRLKMELARYENELVFLRIQKS